MPHWAWCWKIIFGISVECRNIKAIDCVQTWFALVVWVMKLTCTSNDQPVCELLPLVVQNSQKLVEYWLGAMSTSCAAKSTWVANWWSVSLDFSTTEQGLKQGNTYSVGSCFWDIELCDSGTENVQHFLVSFIRQFVNIHWVGLITKISGKEYMLANVPPIVLHPNVTYLLFLHLSVL